MTSAAALERPAVGTRCDCGGWHWWRWRSGQPDAFWRCWACSGGPECGFDTKHVDLVNAQPGEVIAGAREDGDGA